MPADECIRSMSPCCYSNSCFSPSLGASAAHTVARTRSAGTQRCLLASAPRRYPLSATAPATCFNRGRTGDTNAATQWCCSIVFLLLNETVQPVRCRWRRRSCCELQTQQSTGGWSSGGSDDATGTKQCTHLEPSAALSREDAADAGAELHLGITGLCYFSLIARIWLVSPPAHLSTSSRHEPRFSTSQRALLSSCC